MQAKAYPYYLILFFLSTVLCLSAMFKLVNNGNLQDTLRKAVIKNNNHEAEKIIAQLVSEAEKKYGTEDTEPSGWDNSRDDLKKIKEAVANSLSRDIESSYYGVPIKSIALKNFNMPMVYILCNKSVPCYFGALQDISLATDLAYQELKKNLISRVVPQEKVNLEKEIKQIMDQVKKVYLFNDILSTAEKSYSKINKKYKIDLDAALWHVIIELPNKENYLLFIYEIIRDYGFSLVDQENEKKFVVLTDLLSLNNSTLNCVINKFIIKQEKNIIRHNDSSVFIANLNNYEKCGISRNDLINDLILIIMSLKMSGFSDQVQDVIKVLKDKYSVSDQEIIQRENDQTSILSLSAKLWLRNEDAETLQSIKKIHFVNAFDRDGNTMLLMALRKGAPLSIITELLKLGADANQANIEGDMPLILIAKNVVNGLDKIAIAKVLLAKGANPETKDIYGQSFVDIVNDRNEYSMLQLLSKGSDKDMSLPDQRTRLIELNNVLHGLSLLK